MKKERLHYWLKQSRHLICGLILVLVVVFYSMSAFAYADTIGGYFTASNYETFGTRYNLDSETIYPMISGSNISNYIDYDKSKCSSGIWVYYNGSSVGGGITSQDFNSYLKNNYVFPSDLSDPNGVQYDMRNAYHVLGSVYYDGGNYGIADTVFLGSSEIALINNYIVSENPFYVFSYFYLKANGDIGLQSSLSSVTRVQHISTASANGLYCWQFANGSWGEVINFSDLNIYASSSDGTSGFTSFSTDSTDFTFSGNNVNFNFLKSEFGVIGANDPSPLNPSLSEHYLNASMSAKIYGHCFDDVWAGFNFSLNQYQKLHPEEFTVFVSESWTVESPGTGLVTYTSDDFFDISRFVNNGLSYYSIPLDPTDFTVYVGGILMDLDNFFKAEYANVTGLSQNYYNSSNWQTSLNYRGINASFNFQDPSTPLPTVDALLTTGAQAMTKCYIDLVMQITPSNDPDSAGSGIYHYHYNFLTGESTVVQNDMPINVNPLEGDTSGYDIITTGGGSNVTNNSNSPSAFGGQAIVNNNVQAMVEYLFNLDATSLANITGNIHNNFQYVIEKVSDTSENGFWAVLERTYSIIPAPIWTWILTSVGVILAGCTYSWVINGVRIRRG